MIYSNIFYLKTVKEISQDITLDIDKQVICRIIMNNNFLQRKYKNKIHVLISCLVPGTSLGSGITRGLNWSGVTH